MNKPTNEAVLEVIRRAKLRRSILVKSEWPFILTAVNPEVNPTPVYKMFLTEVRYRGSGDDYLSLDVTHYGFNIPSYRDLDKLSTNEFLSLAKRIKRKYGITTSVVFNWEFKTQTWRELP